MTTERDFDRDLGRWLDELSTRGVPEDLLARSLARVAITRQRPGWLVRDRGLAPRARRPRGRWLLVAATVAVGTGVVGASLVGGHLVTPNPAPTISPAVTNPTPAPSSPPSEAPSAFVMNPVVVFNKGTGSSAECGNDGRGGCIARLWVANLDGTGEHELLPDQSGCQRVQAWSPNGTRLLFSRSECRLTEDGMTGAERFYLTDASGSDPKLLDTGCVSPCVSEDDAVFSGDGLRVLFVRTVSVPVEKRTLASIELSTGRVTELGDFDTCDNCGTQWPRSDPLWSPDRSQIVFTWAAGAPMVGPATPGDAPVFVADADGRNAHQLSPAGGFPSWSPDGTRIIFQIDRYEQASKFEYRLFQDVYAIRPDGTDLRRLTTDQISSNPAWTADGRVWFLRTPRVDGHLSADEASENWIMDADGGNAAQLSSPPPFQVWQIQPTA